MEILYRTVMHSLIIQYISHDRDSLTVEMHGMNGLWLEVRKCVYKRINGKWEWWAHDDPPFLANKFNIQNALSELFVNCKGFVEI